MKIYDNVHRLGGGCHVPNGDVHPPLLGRVRIVYFDVRKVGGARLAVWHVSCAFGSVMLGRPNALHAHYALTVPSGRVHW